MPCCTLIAVLLSQFGIAGGAIRMRLSGAASLARYIPAPALSILLRWRWAVLAGIVGFEVLIGAAAAPYLLTPSGRVAAADSFATAWRICSFANMRRGAQPPGR